MVADTTAAPRQLLTQQAQDAPEMIVDALTQVLAAGAQPRHVAFTTRALRALARLASEVDAGELETAASAMTDYEVLVRGLEQLPISVTAHDIERTGPLGIAHLRGLVKRQELATVEGGTISADEVANLLRITRQAVDQRRRKGKLLAVTLGRRGYAYPVWQFGPAGTLPGLELVLADLAGHDPWMRMAFMLTPNSRLDGDTPLAALRRGQIDQVRRAARTYGEHGAA